MLKISGTYDKDPETRILFLILDDKEIEKLKMGMPNIFMVKELIPDFPKCEIRVMYTDDLSAVQAEAMEGKQPQIVHNMKGAKIQ